MELSASLNSVVFLQSEAIGYGNGSYFFRESSSSESVDAFIELLWGDLASLVPSTTFIATLFHIAMSSLTELKSMYTALHGPMSTIPAANLGLIWERDNMLDSLRDSFASLSSLDLSQDMVRTVLEAEEVVPAFEALSQSRCLKELTVRHDDLDELLAVFLAANTSVKHLTILPPVVPRANTKYPLPETMFEIMTAKLFRAMTDARSSVAVGSASEISRIHIPVTSLPVRVQGITKDNSGRLNIYFGDGIDLPHRVVDYHDHLNLLKRVCTALGCDLTMYGLFLPTYDLCLISW